MSCGLFQGASSWPSVFRCPTNALRHELAVILIVESLRPVAKLEINHARPALRARPAQWLAALRMRRGDQRSYVRLDAVAPVNLIVNGEVFQAGGNGMVFGGDVDPGLHIMP